MKKWFNLLRVNTAADGTKFYAEDPYDQTRLGNLRNEGYPYLYPRHAERFKKFVEQIRGKTWFQNLAKKSVLLTIKMNTNTTASGAQLLQH
eukprot:snap_masked-scaffold_14-processed-gene-11.11-mRNA-1 protein AED:1.00 eAED:1.00 QI:0/0/0/0/1/1/2/0/90